MRRAAAPSDARSAVEGITHLARLEAYLSSLPGGLSAYPECQVKGILVRMLASEERYAGVAPRLPEPFRRLLVEPPIGSEWIPEVHYQALIYALADASGEEDDVILAGVRERHRRMFDSPTYRLLMVGSSPAVLLRAADLRWSNWHRGSTLEMEGIADDGVRAVVRFPRGLFDGFQLRIFAESFLAALDLSQARAPRVEIIEAGAGYARYRAAWER
jgi:hypothetical protein